MAEKAHLMTRSSQVPGLIGRQFSIGQTWIICRLLIIKMEDILERTDASNEETNTRQYIYITCLRFPLLNRNNSVSHSVSQVSTECI
jgi:hypothetical protein